MFEKKYYYVKDDSRPFIFLDNIDPDLTTPISEYILTTASKKNLRWDNNKSFEGSYWWTFPFCFRFSEYRNIMLDSAVEKIIKLNELYKLLCPVFEKIEQLRPDLEIFYTEINYILPGERIKPHKDNGGGVTARHWFLGGSCRIHVPLVTNPLAVMTSGGESKHLPVGTIYEFHNNLEHYVENGGNSPRIHLVMDLVPKANKLDLDHFLKQDSYVAPGHIANL
jgi:hypothetical protein